jgi:digeranylgeranylglycerophospholipid reductase
VTIGADGYQSIIRRSNGMERFFSDFCICAQYTLSGLNLDVFDVNEFYLGGVVAPGGYVWVFPKSEKVANVGIGVRKIHNRPAFEYLDKFIKEDPRFKDAKSIHRCGGITPAGGVFDKITDNGLMLIGDAAGQVIPATGGGIHCSVEAGKIAGNVAVDAILSQDTSNKNLSKYREMFDVYWGNRIIESKKIVQMLDKFDDNEINMLAEVVTNEEIIALATGDGAGKAVTKIIARNPGKIVKLMLAYFL